MPIDIDCKKKKFNYRFCFCTGFLYIWDVVVFIHYHEIKCNGKKKHPSIRAYTFQR